MVIAAELGEPVACTRATTCFPNEQLLRAQLCRSVAQERANGE